MELGGSHDRWGHKILLLRSQGWWQVHPSEILKTTIALKGAVFLSAGQASDILNCAGRQIFLLGTAKGPEALLLKEDAHRFFFSPGTLWHPALGHTLHAVPWEGVSTQI